MTRRRQPEDVVIVERQVVRQVWQVDPLGLEIVPGAAPTFEQWAEVGQVLTRVYSTARWAISDWLLFGDHHYESWTQAAEDLGYDVQTIRNYVRVAERFPRASRRAALSWNHHLRVAALPAQEAAGWLDRAVAERWSAGALTAALRDGRPAVSLSLLVALDRAVAGLDRVVQAHPDQGFVAEAVTPHLMGLARAADRLRGGTDG